MTERGKRYGVSNSEQAAWKLDSSLTDAEERLHSIFEFMDNGGSLDDVEVGARIDMLTQAVEHIREHRAVYLALKDKEEASESDA